MNVFTFKKFLMRIECSYPASFIFQSELHSLKSARLTNSMQMSFHRRAELSDILSQ